MKPSNDPHRQTASGSLGLLVALSLIVGGCATTPGASSAGGASVPESSGETGPLLVGTSLTLAPFEFINDEGESTGYELDMITEVARRLGREVAYVRVPFTQNFNSLNAGIFRISAVAAFMRCDRLRDPEGVGRFTVPTYEAGQAVAARTEDIERLNSVEDLEGLTVGVEGVGTTADATVDKILESGINFEKEVFTDNPSLFLALEQGRIDAAMQGEFSVRWTTRDSTETGLAFKVEGTAFPVGFILRDGDPLLEDVNETINEMKQDGTMKQIYNDWFDEDPAPDSVTVNVVATPTADEMCARED